MTTDTITLVSVPGWPRPRGYANGAVGQGRVLHVAGQIGVDPEGRLVQSEGLVGEFAQALHNVVAVVRAAGGDPCHIASMTIYTTDVQGYRDAPEGLGDAWRAHLGKHYPAIALVGVTRLYEAAARVEIQAVAYLP